MPALSLAESYAFGEAYDYGEALDRAARLVLGPDLAETVVGRVSLFQDTGRERLGEGGRARLRERFAGLDHPGAREIVAWLDGDWIITAEEIAAS